MHGRQRSRGIPVALRCAAMLALAIAGLIVATSQGGLAQTFTVLHAFTGGPDGSGPYADVTLDASGNLYGTTSGTGGSGAGTVFRLRQIDGSWILDTLYSFSGGEDGAFPYSGVTIAHDGTLYGATSAGGGIPCNDPYGCGTIFHLSPPPNVPRTATFPWNETVLYRFTGEDDGQNPEGGSLTLDAAGNLYGTAIGGQFNDGVVFEVSHSQSGWTESVLYAAHDLTDGERPNAGVVFDRSGNIYGVMGIGGDSGGGVVYELSLSGSQWTEQTIYNIRGGQYGSGPEGQLIIDSSGHLYGTTCCAGPDGSGTVFEMFEDNGNWGYSVLWGFLCLPAGSCDGPDSKVVMDAAGNLYGTTVTGGIYNCGTAYKLTYSSGGWQHSTLHDFTGGSDGCQLRGAVAVDANGNVYGTTVSGGQGHGVVFQIAQ